MNYDMIHQLMRALEKNRIESELFSTKDELIDSINHFLQPKAIVGVGDSKTLEQLGIYTLLRNSSCVFLDKYKPDITKKEKYELYRKNFLADLFISGVNAITLEGKIFNLDGNGSRVAPIIFGPKKVFLICGTNKIVPNDKAAIYRIRNMICNYYSIIQGQFDKQRIKVLLIEGEYGF